MSETPSTANPSDLIVLSIPILVRKRGGRKRIITPDGQDLYAKTSESAHNATAKPTKEPVALAIARAHRWLDLIERGKYANAQDLAKALGYDASYVHRLLRLTLLRPDFIEDILNNREPDGFALEKMRDVPEVWGEQGP